MAVIEAPQPEGGDNLRFLLVGTFSYPLVGQPALRAAEGMYVVPVEGSTEAYAVTVVEAAAPERAQFEDTMRALTQLRDRTTGEILEPVDRSWGGKVAQNVLWGSQKVASGVVAGATYAGKGMVALGNYITSKTSHKKDIAVSDTTKGRIKSAKVATSAAVTVTAGIVASVASMAVHMGKAIGSAVNETSVGKKLAEKGDSETGRAVKKIAGSAIVGFATVWEGLEQGARIVCKDTARATTAVVGHRYGDEAAAATADGLAVVGNVGESAFNLRQVGTKALVRVTAKETAKTLLDAPPVPARTSSSSASSAPAAMPATAPSTAPPVPPRRGGGGASKVV
jgi:hypothetical protein